MQHTWGPVLRALNPRESKTIASDVYERIRADIVGGRLRPGEKLYSELLKERYDAGSSPVREALSHLTADGLVNAESQKGFRVAEVSLPEFVDIARQRLRLESLALLDAIRFGGVDWEVEIVARYHRLRHSIGESAKGEEAYADHWEMSHRAFHFALLDGCGQPWLLSFCERLYDQMERYRRAFVAYRQIPKDLLEEHGEIMNAVLARDTARALMLVREHILRATELTERDLRAQGIMGADSVPVGIRQLLLAQEETPQAPETRRAG